MPIPTLNPPIPLPHELQLSLQPEAIIVNRLSQGGSGEVVSADKHLHAPVVIRYQVLEEEEIDKLRLFIMEELSIVEIF